jgi:hypothetical protein
MFELHFLPFFLLLITGSSLIGSIFFLIAIGGFMNPTVLLLVIQHQIDKTNMTSLI